MDEIAGRTAGQIAALTMGGITTTTLVLIALFALLAVAVIVWGTLYRRRVARDRAESEAHAVEAAPPAPEMPAELAPPPAELPTEPPPAELPTEPPPALTVAAGAPLLPLTLLKGLGPKVAARFAELGYSDVQQLAVLSADEADTLADQLGPFKARLARDQWLEQARLLAAGDRAAFEARFGKLGDDLG